MGVPRHGSLGYVNINALLDSRSEITSVSEAMASKRQQEMYDGPIIEPFQGIMHVRMPIGYVRTVERHNIPMRITLTTSWGGVHFQVHFAVMPSLDDFAGNLVRGVGGRPTPNSFATTKDERKKLNAGVDAGAGNGGETTAVGGGAWTGTDIEEVVAAGADVDRSSGAISSSESVGT